MINKLIDLFRPTIQTEETVDVAMAASAIMFEIVWADHEIEQSELVVMASALIELFDLDQVRLKKVMAQAQTHHEQSVGVYHFTRTLNEQLDQTQKFDVLVALWKIAMADDHIGNFEEHMIRRLADLLYVSHANFIRAKHAARAAST